MKRLLGMVLLAVLAGCGPTKLDIAGTGAWAVFEASGRIDGSGPTTLEVARRQRITVQLLDDHGPLTARIRTRRSAGPWQEMVHPLEAVEFYVN